MGSLTMVSELRAEDDVSSEQDPLLKPLNENNADNQAVEHSVPKSIARRLYLSHFLSTWNSRVFEFGAVLYLATIYPGTLLPMSIYAFTRGFSAIIFAPAVGQYIDTGNRLQVVRVSIVVQRIVVATSCVLFYILAIHLPLGRGGKTGMLVALSFLACIEKLCSIMNLISVEKDWLVVVCRKDQTALRALNAQMRRIDLLCKLLGPLFIALVDGASTKDGHHHQFLHECCICSFLSTSPSLASITESPTCSSPSKGRVPTTKKIQYRMSAKAY